MTFSPPHKNTHRILRDDHGIRLHKWIRKTFPDLPLSLIHRFLRTKKVRHNSKRAKGDEVLSEGDEVRLFFYTDVPRNEYKKSPSPSSLHEAKKHLSILFEDEYILALHKPANIAVHPGTGTGIGRSIIEMAESLFPNITPRLVHRLDKETSGVLLLAKDGGSLRVLLKDLQSHQFKKTYFALVFGSPPEKSGTIRLSLRRHDMGKKMRIGSGKHAITHYNTLHQKGDFTFLQIDLETGRTHQIRAHFSALGCPLVGDNAYGSIMRNKAFFKKTGLKRQFLHAHSLEFPHPVTQEMMHIIAPLPDDLQKGMKEIGISHT